MTALITGGTSGIGKAAAEMFAAKGWKVHSLSRREGVDVTDFAALEAAVNRVVAEDGRIDALVNNAGIGIFGAAELADFESIRRQFEVNFFGAVRLTQLVLPIMRKQGMGNIVNVASCAAMFPLPYQSFYSASKAALLNWSRALSGEVRQLGINVTCICPGDVKTGFTASRIHGDSPQKVAGIYEKRQKHALSKAEASENGGGDPLSVAREIVTFASAKHPPLVAIPGMRYAWLDRLARLLPRTWVSRLIDKFYL